MAHQVTLGELRAAAKDRGVDPDQSYEALREQIEVYECKHCGDEHLYELHGGCCSDACQAAYIHKHHR